MLSLPTALPSPSLQTRPGSRSFRANVIEREVRPPLTVSSGLQSSLLTPFSLPRSGAGWRVPGVATRPPRVLIQIPGTATIKCPPKAIGQGEVLLTGVVRVHAQKPLLEASGSVEELTRQGRTHCLRGLIGSVETASPPLTSQPRPSLHRPSLRSKPMSPRRLPVDARLILPGPEGGGSQADLHQSTQGTTSRSNPVMLPGWLDA